jgi:hypothetical protein
VDSASPPSPIEPDTEPSLPAGLLPNVTGLNL